MKKKINILFVIDTLQTGGAEKSILEISKYFRTATPLVCTLFRDEDDLEDHFKASQIKIYTLNLNKKSKLWFWEGKRAFEDLIKDIQPTIIHAHLFKSDIISRIASIPKSIPLISAFVNDSYSSERYNEQNFVRNLKLTAIKFVDRVTAKRVYAFTSITRSIAISNAKALKIKEDKITTIYRGRPIDDYTMTQPFYDENDQFIFLIVARLLKRKGYFELIDAIEQLNTYDPHLNFVCKVAGDGVDAAEIKSYASVKKVNNYIKFLGNQKNVSDLHQGSHCFIFPSHYEGQGGALIEAMLSAKPIILTNIPVFREQIEEGRTGVFFKLKDSENMAIKMRWMMENYEKGKEMGLNARAYAVKKFDIINIATQYEAFYQKIKDQFLK